MKLMVSSLIVSVFRDLGVAFYSQLTFTDHYKNIILFAYRTLGFITRLTKNFTNLNAVKMLYVSLVRPKLEFAALVWSSNYLKYSKDLKSVQRRFLKYLAYKKYSS